MEVGQKYKLFFNPRNVNNGKIEIRAIVDDKQVVYLFNGEYRMDSVFLFDMYLKEGHLTTAST